MSFRAGFNIVLYDKEATWGGSLKERWGIGTIFYENILIFSRVKIWLPWKHEVDAKAMIK